MGLRFSLTRQTSGIPLASLCGQHQGRCAAEDFCPRALVTTGTHAPYPRSAGMRPLSQENRHSSCGIRDGGSRSASPVPIGLGSKMISSKMLPLPFEVYASKSQAVRRKEPGQFPTTAASLSPLGVTFVTIHCRNEWRPHSWLY